MKIAAISDIHGNVAALDAVLGDIATRHVDQIVNLGDICSGGLFPQETADRLMPLGLPTIRGNHERQISEQPRERMGLSDRHAFDQLSAEQHAWLTALPTTMRLSKDVLLVHGTPDSDLTYFLETVTEAGLRQATREEVRHRAGIVDAAVILCGHTHLQRVMTLDDGRIIINPGSVGLPAYDDDRPHAHLVESGSPHARYAVLSNEGDGWVVEFLSVDYDWEQAARDAEANARTDWSRPLRTGRV
ncbi:MULTISPECIES: metallophosphoesterase family protein [Sphingomonas]|uniref:metallophosphoesterase family protein n=1 Tax=Sphingomonas TaxID=13687 RepID=UPI0006F656FD|nr:MULTISPECIES: metallophosphoesterase family protein [Sphingomonas]KQM92940.1 metallophosphoesterase [Sphingomonas sp. Leaf226]MDY0967358.1 metallophosphoesterase family protein [Sphingomonas sp. CFBP9021]USR01116.1 metallophosphatase family protein [Sphingomonas aerolata]